VYYEALSLDNIAKLADLEQNVIQDLQNTPSIESPALSLTPDNFTSFNSGESLSVLNPKSFDYKLDTALSKLESEINKSISGIFDELKGNFLPNDISIESIDEKLDQNLKSIQDQFSIESTNMVLDMFKSNSSVESLGSINQSYESIFNSAANLSPKGIRDLNNSEILTQKIDQTASQATQNVRNEVKSQTSELIQNKDFNNSGQTNLQQISNPAFSGNNSSGFDLFVRLTVYWAKGSGTDKDSAAMRSSTGRQLAQGVSAAVDPSVIPYLSRIEIPGLGTRYATDTGGAVKARTASRGSLPIIDIFYENKQDALAAANKIKNEVTVKVFPPQNKYKYVKNSAPTYGVA